eukprot:338958_1
METQQCQQHKILVLSKTNVLKPMILQLCISQSTAILRIKKYIENKKGIPTNQQLFYFDGHELKDEFKIAKDSTFCLSLQRTFSIGDEIDCCDRWGKWCLAQVKQHRYPSYIMSNIELNEAQKAIADKLRCLQAIYVHYIGYDKKYDEWVFIENNTFCDCSTSTPCDCTNHRIATCNTQSWLKKLKAVNQRLKLTKLRQTQLVGNRFDIYDLTIKQWWPCTVIDADHEYIKVSYDGYSSKYDEWIKNNERIAAIHKHTKKK